MLVSVIGTPKTTATLQGAARYVFYGCGVVDVAQLSWIQEIESWLVFVLTKNVCIIQVQCMPWSEVVLSVVSTIINWNLLSLHWSKQPVIIFE